MPAVPRLRAASLRRAAGACAVFAGSFAIGRGVSAPRHDIGDLAAVLGEAVGGVVEPRDVRWEPSEGVTSDFLFGRWALFLASETKGGARDVWRARVRLTPEGRPLDVSDAHDLTSTPLGDDHALVVSGRRAAFATYAFGQEQSVTLLDLAGEGAQNKTTSWADRAMAHVTNLQQTGSGDGVARTDVTLDQPARAVGLALTESALAIDLADAPGGAATRRARLDVGTGALATDAGLTAEGMHVEAARHLPKRFVFWAVDTARAVSWIGPAPIAWLEDKAWAIKDGLRRLAFKLHGDDATETLATTAGEAPSKTAPGASAARVLDGNVAVDAAEWPPPPIASIWKSPEQGEGEWVAPKLSWIKKLPTADATTPPAFVRTFVRPDPDRPYAQVLLVAMDMRQLDVDMEAGLEDPKPLVGTHGPGRIPRDPRVYTRVAAAFNGAFKTEHGNYGMMVHKRVLLPPQPAAASVVVLRDGRVGLGTWPQTTEVGGLKGIADGDIASFRQNLDPLVDGDQVNPTKRALWGFTLPGTSAQTERTGLCVTRAGHLIYAWGDDASASTIAKAMHMAGCIYGMHLDMNPHHTGFVFANIEDPKAHKYKAQLLSDEMEISPDRYMEFSPKDFFYVMVHDPTPPAVDGAAAWQVDGGTQPAPAWMPALWATSQKGTGANASEVTLVDVEPARATWRLRAGTSEPDAKTGAQPLREVTGDEAQRVLFSIGLGASSERKPLGLATDGKMVLAMGGLAKTPGTTSAALVVREDGSLAIAKGEELAVGPHVDAAEVPLILDDGKPVASGASGLSARAALGITGEGRVVIARGEAASDAPLAEALARAGCVRGVALWRGPHADVTLRRAGTATPPRDHEEATTLFAIASSLKPRAFRFEPEEKDARAAK